MSIFRNDTLFQTACRTGDIILVKNIMELDRDTAKDSYAFQLACVSGHLNVMKEFFSYARSIHLNDGIAFRLACAKGHLNILYYFFDNKVNISLCDKYAFKTACQYGQYDVARWLYVLNCNAQQSADNEVF